MLKDTQSYVVHEKEGRRGVTVETAFVEIDLDVRKAVTGDDELWFHIESKPAFEVACLTIEKQGDEPLITLMKKRRLEDDEPRIKVPGGYLWDEAETYIPQKILADTGIELAFNDLVGVGHVIGHSEIVTPIELYFTTKWVRLQDPREGIEVFSVPLRRAARMAIGHVVENDSSFSLIMRLYYLWQEGRLAELVSPPQEAMDLFDPK